MLFINYRVALRNQIYHTFSALLDVIMMIMSKISMTVMIVRVCSIITCGNVTIYIIIIDLIA